jgi:type IV pilus assembly protein PilY1
LDIDLDHVVDYIYAGDLLGNIWRFDVTSQNPAQWAVSASSPLFTTPSGEPITTRLAVGTLRKITTTKRLSGITISNDPERVIINFGTGRTIPQTVTSPAQYASGAQYLYGIWDWDMSAWNLQSPPQLALSLPAPQLIAGPASSTPNLQQQTITTVAASGAIPAYRSVSHTPVCWKGASGCSPAAMLGWYVQLPVSGEQVIFDPVLSRDGELVVNTFVPPSNSILSCKAAQSTGFSMGLQPDSGGGSATPYFYLNADLSVDGVQLNGVGIPALLSSGQSGDQNAEYFITQTTGGPVPPTKVNRHVVVTGQRLNWIQRR